MLRKAKRPVSVLSSAGMPKPCTDALISPFVIRPCSTLAIKPRDASFASLAPATRLQDNSSSIKIGICLLEITIQVDYQDCQVAGTATCYKCKQNDM